MTAATTTVLPVGRSLRLRARPVPDSEPAVDAQLRLVPAPAPRSVTGAPEQPTLALAPTITLGPTGADEPAASSLDGADAERPDARTWSRHIAQAVAEVLSGIRPVAQLARWTSRDVYETLRRRSTLAAGQPGPRRRAVVRTVRACRPTAGVVEAAAVVVIRGRVRAVAFRLEAAQGRWRMTVLELG